MMQIRNRPGGLNARVKQFLNSIDFQKQMPVIIQEGIKSIFLIEIFGFGTQRMNLQ